MFKVGQRVICIDASPGEYRHFFHNWLEESVIYTVRESANVLGFCRILLEEVSNSPVSMSELGGKVEPGFAARRFADAESYLLRDINFEQLENAMA